MTTNDPYADHAHMANHWWWRPGWQVGTRFYAWHLTLDGQDEVHALADRYAESLRNVPTLDPIPSRWRHMTLQGLGQVEDVDDHTRDSVIEAVSKRLRDMEPIRSTFSRAAVFREAIALPPNNPPSYAELRREIRAGLADVLGVAPEAEAGFRAHVSLAYSNNDGDGLAIRQILDSTGVVPATATFTTVSLIRMHRDNRMYEWETVAEVQLTST